MKRFIRSAPVRLFAALLIALSLGSLLSLALRGNHSPLTSAVGLITTPLQGLSASLSRSLQDVAAHFKSSTVLQAQLAKKEEEIRALRQRVVDYDNLKKDNALYEKFLGLKEKNPDYQFARATVIGTDAARYFGSLILNRGSLSGIAVNNPVIFGNAVDGGYLVGIVTKVAPTSATVETILNPNVNVSIYDTKSSETIGVATSTAEWAEQGYCVVSQLERSTFIDRGDLLCTSGLGGLYPKDLIVGTVVETRDEAASVTAVVAPAADMEHLRDVFVLIAW
ncbi:MAG: rod shape-determining protein MreC [Oscillospiraceae bacterium]|nr:rod shape-determining protein MreC [Oscillospiraceae bacterium]